MRQITKGKVLAAALVLGVITAGLVYWFLAKQASIAQANKQVVIAAQEIPRNTPISVDMLRLGKTEAEDPGIATSLEMVVGKVAKDRFEAGEPIALQSIQSPGGLSGIVPPFMRAVTVALDPIIGVGGFLQPGNHVDVVATFNVNNGTVTKTVLQDVELLATGAEVVSGQEEGKGGKAKEQPNATLAVMPTDAEKLILAESKGKLRLTLRGPDDISFVRTNGITSRALLGHVPPDVPPTGQASPSYPTAYQPSLAASMAIPTPKLEPLPPPEPAGKTVMVIRGTKVEEAVVNE